MFLNGYYIQEDSSLRWDLLGADQCQASRSWMNILTILSDSNQ
jgi:hypothetical protein